MAREMDHAGGSDAPLHARLDALFRAVAARRDVHHAIAAVESGDGAFRWARAHGEANPGGPPMQVETPFFIASVDKLFTATVTMRFVEAGRLRLDEPVRTYLPGAICDRLHIFRGTDYSSRITLRHLLGHTSGLPDYLEDRPRRGRSLVDELAADGDRGWSLEEMAARVRERLTPHFPPQPADARRVKARYSDTNYRLLDRRSRPSRASGPRGVRARAVRAARHASHVGERVGQVRALPLRLRRRSGSVPSRSRFPARWPRSAVSSARSATRCASCARSSAASCSTDPRTYALMQERWNRFGLPLDAAALRSPNWPIEYGLGLMRFRLPRWLTPFGAVPALDRALRLDGLVALPLPRSRRLPLGTVDQATAGSVPYRFLPKVLRALQAAPTGSGAAR
jgi:D-alanyl-D-alanine carboxypeptidase